MQCMASQWMAAEGVARLAVVWIGGGTQPMGCNIVTMHPGGWLPRKCLGWPSSWYWGVVSGDGIRWWVGNWNSRD